MSGASDDKGESGWLTRLAPWLLVGGLVLFHALNNWLWLSENVTSTGWDKPRHLARSLHYAHLLSAPTLQSLFDLMTGDMVRPPLFPASAAILYALFGRTADVATMVNVVYLALALAATYGIGRRWGGRRLGMVSAALLAFFPMFYSMSRYFYLEFSLLAMVTLTVYLLLTTDGFRRRGPSLLFGLSLGLALLTKRTSAVFIAGPIMVVVLASGLLPALWQRLKQRPRLYWKRALIAVVIGFVPAALWYWPNQEAVRALILGDALFFLWWALAGLTIYWLLLPAAPWSNALAALFLGASIASSWYLARVEFLQRVAVYGYGVGDPRGRELRLDNVNTYLYYLRKLGNEHLSLFLFAVFVLVLIIALFVYVRRQGSLGAALRRLRPEGWAVLAWVGGGYVVLTLSIYQETRALTPVLPAVALIFGAALLKLPWRRLRWGLLALILVFGAVQFLVLSYEPVNRLLPPRQLDLPGWGRSSTLAQGVYIQLPDEGVTDSGYWIEPDVLERMEDYRQAEGQEVVSAALLVNTSQINAGPFNYLILTQYPHLRVESLIRRFDDTSPYRRLFGHEYVLLKRQNSSANPAQQVVIDAILDGPPQLFAQLYELETTYALPDGGTVYLYRQRCRLPADYPIEYITRLAEDLSDRTRQGDAILLTPPQIAAPFVAHYDGPAELYAAPFSEEEMAEIAAPERRIFLVVGDAQAGPVPGSAQAWLDEHTFRAVHEWSDSLQLLIYGLPAEPAATSPSVVVGAVLGDQVELAGYDLPAQAYGPGDIVPLTLFWQRRAAVDEDYKVFVHLLDGQGGLVAQTDSAPANGARPTSQWAADELVLDRHGLLLPESLPPAGYELLVGMYHPATGERLAVQDAAGQAVGDSLHLGSLRTRGP